MDAIDEARSLRTDPLPPVVIMNPLYTVIMMDLRIKEAQEEIAYCSAERQKALDFAIANNVTQEGNLRLVTDVRQPNQKVNVEKLRTEKPDAFALIQGTQRRYLVERVREQFRNLGAAISITELKKALPQKAVHESFLHRPGEPTISYSVVDNP